MKSLDLKPNLDIEFIHQTFNSTNFPSSSKSSMK